MKKLITAIIIMFNASLIAAQTDSTAAADSTKLANLMQQKKQVVEFIVQKQSEIYEAEKQLKEAYNKLSQLNIAIQLYEEKLKLYRELKK
ncbi:hypothetical protein ACSSWA_01295 [Melioribacter sp. Ez-97]|uniref:hypothetical protein n=1 Tax=Melioribacter sp. Ez-97 TaxID=3423434 RepID=UPI003EDA7951